MRQNKTGQNKNNNNIKVNCMKHPMNLLHYLQFQFKMFLTVNHIKKNI